MESFSFSGLGTGWTVLIDGDVIHPQVKNDILVYTQTFEKRFSRFLPGSEVNAFRTSEAGEYILSSDFLLLLETADRLRSFTRGKYDPAVATVLESVGYGGKQGLPFVTRGEKNSFPQWSLCEKKLVIDGPIAFDLGGIGKGYCIDGIASILHNAGYKYFLVEGGGDMVATTKVDGSFFRIAVEFPGKPDTASSIVHLINQGIAVSDIFRRRFGKWHHLIDPHEKVVVKNIIGCTAVTPNAFFADCMTSGLFFAPTEQYEALAEAFEASYIVFYEDGTARISHQWEGEIL